MKSSPPSANSTARCVDTLLANIVAAIEEQATVTKDVAGNIAQASAEVSKIIARDIADLNTTVGDIRQGGEQVQIRAVDLSKVAEQLSAQVAQFRM